MNKSPTAVTWKAHHHARRRNCVVAAWCFGSGYVREFSGSWSCRVKILCGWRCWSCCTHVRRWTEFACCFVAAGCLTAVASCACSCDAGRRTLHSGWPSSVWPCRVWENLYLAVGFERQRRSRAWMYGQPGAVSSASLTDSRRTIRWLLITPAM